MTRKKVGLALSGGAARGFAHLGVVKVLKEHNIPIDFIAGTSAGSFAGGAIAAGMSIENIIEVG
ncbi:MAG: patatin-like phospholipase family protein, partial [Aridibacter sp.]